MENEFNYSPNNDFKKSSNKSNGFGKRALTSFLCGILGAGLVVGICFGVPSIKESLFNMSTETNEEANVATNETKVDNSGYDATLMSIAEYSETSVAVAEKVLPSVVGITVTYNVSSYAGTSQAEATGSGVIISEDGYIITNNHVVNSESSSYYYQVTEAVGIKVHLYGDDSDTQYDAKIVGSDSQTDLAVLKIEPKEDLQAIEFGDSDNVKVGEFVMAVGNPLGLDSSVSCGVVSAMNREITDSDGNTYVTIQTDAAINAGNSGGALVNSKGELIGINSLKLSGEDIEGIGFAITINPSLDIIDQLITYGVVKRPYIGISGQALTESLAQRYNLPVGVYVQEVVISSPAEDAGIKTGDVIVEVAGQKVTTVDEINTIKNTYSIGDTLNLKIYRDGEYQTITVTLGETASEDSTTTTTTTSPQLYR